MRKIKWYLARKWFILNRVIQGDSLTVARMEWTYFCLDQATLALMPETPKNLLPSSALKEPIIINRGDTQ